MHLADPYALLPLSHSVWLFRYELWSFPSLKSTPSDSMAKPCGGTVELFFHDIAAAVVRYCSKKPQPSCKLQLHYNARFLLLDVLIDGSLGICRYPA